MEREVLPIVGKNFRLVYEPLFIAMGTVLRDFLWPEFVLIGADSRDAAQELVEFYKTIHNAPVFVTDIRTAEGIKVFYNTFITMKTVLGNMYGEMAHKLGMNVDDIYEALSLAKDRLISNKYLKAGMGDGGGCHPRDNIALSYVARRVGLSFDMFDALMTAREKHAEWLADLIEYHRTTLELRCRCAFLGKAFKPNTNLDSGSPARLLSSILSERNIGHRIADEYPRKYYGAALFFIGTQHERTKRSSFLSDRWSLTRSGTSPTIRRSN
jgi:UDPglucose 6-dehydrogenase